MFLTINFKRCWVCCGLLAYLQYYFENTICRFKINLKSSYELIVSDVIFRNRIVVALTCKVVKYNFWEEPVEVIYLLFLDDFYQTQQILFFSTVVATKFKQIFLDMLLIFWHMRA